jgi:hypothetical protein
VLPEFCSNRSIPFDGCREETFCWQSLFLVELRLKVWNHRVRLNSDSLLVQIKISGHDAMSGNNQARLPISGPFYEKNCQMA